MWKLEEILLELICNNEGNRDDIYADVLDFITHLLVTCEISEKSLLKAIATKNNAN